ncbi:DUF2946 family protein [Pollutimonas sp. M17]|uniref:DUF2946 family protein n=1 Tax=Pollutimonas sp. M17 TaxID=2962065 RepID=UPI0021F4D8E5|nr:DUF2946 family protein [Pollutimonas sp. M17]UYO92851.1 DUF2946 family protein [Pollutimonas sp. M17]
MDENVVAAMARWPDVPDVFGWLSLTERGEWRLHPRGDALDAHLAAGQGLERGEAISSPPILRFIDRNYGADEAGQWYFQNGPQKVYVRLDAAPYVVHATGGPDNGPSLTTHNGLPVNELRGWWLDDEGRLYTQTEHGPALVAGRDLESVLSWLRAPDGGTALEWLEARPWAAADVLTVEWAGIPEPSAELRFCPARAIPGTLGFVARPRPA